MRTIHALRALLVLVTAAGCENGGLVFRDKDLGVVCTEVFGDMGFPSKGEMGTVKPAPCAAAQGLSGDNLLCVDFDKVLTLTDPALNGWNFKAGSGGMDCWEIKNQQLQIANFATFVGSCALTLMPIDLKLPDKQKYQRVTLSLVHRVDMSEIDQQAQVFLSMAAPARQIQYLSSRQGIPAQTTTIMTVNKTDLPMALNGVYTFLLNAGSLSVRGGLGWQISSIAVNASQ